MLSMHYLRGGLFESMIIADLFKSFYNQAQQPSIYFWHDSHGHEVDCVIDMSIKLIPIEIKSSETIDMSFFKGLEYWNNLAQANPKDSYIIYGGKENQHRSKGNIVSWSCIPNFVEKI